MKLTVIGSSSEGNAYVLQNECEALLLEAGLPFKKTLAALEYNTTKVAGCLITHEHGDHAGRANEYLGNAIDIYASEGTCKAIAAKAKRNLRCLHGIAKTGNGYGQLTLGGFTITPFATKHDSAEPLGFLIWHDETGGLLFATDTSYLPNRLAWLSNILIECNYDQRELERHLEDGGLDWGRYKRVRENHMSLDTCTRALTSNDLSKVNNIVLLHLSNDHADPAHFQDTIHRATGKTTHIAKPGLEIEINATPF